MSFLTIKGLSLSIDHLPILHDINLSVRKGEIVGVIGPNGSGKTTLFNCINGFFTDYTGRIILQGRDITKLPTHQRARLGLGRTFQHFGVFREMTVLENMQLALENNLPWWRALWPWSQEQKRIKARAQKILKKIGLQNRQNEKASSLSGGQMRLLEIQRTVASGAQLLLLDEPTAGVSPKMKNEISQLLRDIREQGVTIMIIEHDITFIQQFCDRIIVLDQGKVALSGSPAEIKSSQRLQKIYFGK